MRIVVYTPTFFPTYVGGGERLAAVSARGLAARGAEVHLLTAGPEGGTYEHEGIRVHTVPHAGGSPGEIAYGPIERPLDAVLTALLPDVVHLMGIAGALPLARRGAACGARIGLAAMEYSAFCRNRTLIRGSGRLCAGRISLDDCFRCRLEGLRARDVALGRLGRRLPRSLGHYLSRRATRIAGRPLGHQLRWWDATRQDDAYRQAVVDRLAVFVAPTRFALAATSPHLDRGVLTAVVPYPVAWTEPPPRKRTPSDRLIVGFVGRAIPIKGLEVLLAAADLATARVPIELRIYCPENADWSDYRRAMKVEARRRPYARWIESGELDRKGLTSVHAGLDVLAVPSRWPEFFGFTTLEALSLGTPVILSDYPNQRELFGHVGEGVRFVAPGDAAALAEAVADLWKLKRRGELRVGEFHALTIEEYAAKLLELYEAAA